MVDTYGLRSYTIERFYEKAPLTTTHYAHLIPFIHRIIRDEEAVADSTLRALVIAALLARDLDDETPPEDLTPAQLREFERESAERKALREAIRGFFFLPRTFAPDDASDFPAPGSEDERVVGEGGPIFVERVMHRQRWAARRYFRALGTPGGTAGSGHKLFSKIIVYCAEQLVNALTTLDADPRHSMGAKGAFIAVAYPELLEPLHYADSFDSSFYGITVPGAVEEISASIRSTDRAKHHREYAREIAYLADRTPPEAHAIIASLQLGTLPDAAHLADRLLHAVDLILSQERPEFTIALFRLLAADDNDDVRNLAPRLLAGSLTEGTGSTGQEHP